MATQEAEGNDASAIAVVLYDTFDSAIKARRILESKPQREAIQWAIKPWRMDMLRATRAAEEAMADSVNAHLIFISVGRVQQWLPGRLEWLETWAAFRKVKAAGVALLDSGTPTQTGPERYLELRQFAETHGLSLICNDGLALGRMEPGFVDELGLRERSLTPTLNRILERTSY